MRTRIRTLSTFHFPRRSRGFKSSCGRLTGRMCVPTVFRSRISGRLVRARRDPSLTLQKRERSLFDALRASIRVLNALKASKTFRDASVAAASKRVLNAPRASRVILDTLLASKRIFDAGPQLYRRRRGPLSTGGVELGSLTRPERKEPVHPHTAARPKTRQPKTIGTYVPAPKAYLEHSPEGRA